MLNFRRGRLQTRMIASKSKLRTMMRKNIVQLDFESWYVERTKEEGGCMSCQPKDINQKRKYTHFYSAV